MGDDCSVEGKVLFNHAINIIGYGTEDTDVGPTDYWLIQNSWGANWGENGYAKIARGQSICGLAESLFIPTTVYDPAIDKTRPFQRHLHKYQSTGARCLDGSEAGVYFSPGNGTSKTVLYFEGGGWCSGHTSDQVLQSCLDRSVTDLGTSLNWQLEGDYDYVFRADPDKDVFFADWNKFVIKYCDGGRHQSYLEEPVTFKDTKLYFRGHANTIAALEFVNKMLPLEITSDFVL